MCVQFVGCTQPLGRSSAAAGIDSA